MLLEKLKLRPYHVKTQDRAVEIRPKKIVQGAESITDMVNEKEWIGAFPEFSAEYIEKNNLRSPMAMQPYLLVTGNEYLVLENRGISPLSLTMVKALHGEADSKWLSIFAETFLTRPQSQEKGAERYQTIENYHTTLERPFHISHTIGNIFRLGK